MKKLILISCLLALTACDAGFDSKAPTLNEGSEAPPTGTPPTPGTLCAEAKLNWTNPTKNTDGSDIVDPLSKNTLYYGFAPRTYSNEIIVSNPPALGTYRIVNLEIGKTYYFSVSATDAAGVSSDYSAEATKTMVSCAETAVKEINPNEIILDVNNATDISQETSAL